MHAISSARPWYTHRWPWFLMLGPFLVVIAGSVTGYLAYPARTRWWSTTTTSLRRDRAGTALGLVFEARYDPANGTLHGSLLAAGRPARGTIRIQLAHSTQVHKDIELAAALDERGGFRVALPMLERARWGVVIEGERRDWRLARSWRWPQQQVLDIKADLPPAA